MRIRSISRRLDHRNSCGGMPHSTLSYTLVVSFLCLSCSGIFSPCTLSLQPRRRTHLERHHATRKIQPGIVANVIAKSIFSTQQVRRKCEGSETTWSDTRSSAPKVELVFSTSGRLTTSSEIPMIAALAWSSIISAVRLPIYITLQCTETYYRTSIASTMTLSQSSRRSALNVNVQRTGRMV